MNAIAVFEDFEVTIARSASGDFKVWARTASGTTEKYPIQLPSGRMLLEKVESTTSYRGIVDDRLGTAEAGPAGRCLFSAIFQGSILGAFMGDLNHRPKRVVLRLPDDPAWHALAWERMSFGDNPLGRDVNVSIVRGYSGLRRAERDPPQKPRLLIAQALPQGLDPLQLDREVKLIEDCLSPNWQVGIVRSATRQELETALIQGWDLLHFMGHGANHQAMLSLESEDGMEHVLTSTGICDLLLGVAHRALPRIIVLNACYSGKCHGDLERLDGVALKLVGHGIPNVVAMTEAIEDEHALSFSRGFYASLNKGETLDTAVTRGRRNIERDELWHLPALFSSASAHQVWCVAGSQETTAAPAARTAGMEEQQGPLASQGRFSRRVVMAALAVVTLVLLALGALSLHRFLPAEPHPLIHISHNFEPGGPWLAALAAIDQPDLPLTDDPGKATHIVAIERSDQLLTYRMTDRGGTALLNEQTNLPGITPLEVSGILQATVAHCLVQGGLKPGSVAASGLAALLLRTSGALMDRGRTTVAKNVLHRARALDASFTAAANLAVLLLEEGEFKAASELSREVIEHEADPVAYYTLATALAPTDPEAASTALEKAVLVDPLFLEAQNMLGRLHLQAGRDRAARRKFEFCLEHKPTYAPALHGLADLLMAGEQWDEARVNLMEAARYTPLRHTSAQSILLYKRARCEFALSRPEETCRLVAVYAALPWASQLAEWAEMKSLREQAGCASHSETTGDRILLTSSGVLLAGREALPGQEIQPDQKISLDAGASILLAVAGALQYAEGPLRCSLGELSADGRDTTYKTRDWLPAFADRPRIMPGQKGAEALLIIGPRGSAEQNRPYLIWVPAVGAKGYRLSLEQDGFEEGRLDISSGDLHTQVWFPDTLPLEVVRLDWPFPELPAGSVLDLHIEPYYEQGSTGPVGAVVSFRLGSGRKATPFEEDDPGIVGHIRERADREEWPGVFQACRALNLADHSLLLAEMFLRAGLPELALMWYANADAFSLSPESRAELVTGWGYALLALRRYPEAEIKFRQAKIIHTRAGNTIALKKLAQARELILRQSS